MRVITGNGKIHYKNNRFILCGKKLTPYMIGMHGATNFSDNKADVTCRSCQNAILKYKL